MSGIFYLIKHGNSLVSICFYFSKKVAMINDIIEYLFDNNNGSYIPLNEFLKRFENNLWGVNEAIRAIDGKGWANFDGSWSDLGNINGKDLTNVLLSGKIRPEGISYCERLKTERKQNEILERQSSSILETNLSIRETNTITKDWIRQQKFFTKVIMWATVVTAISAGIAAFKEIKTLYNNKLQEISKSQVTIVDTTSSQHQIKIENKLDSHQLTFDTILHKK